MKLHDDIHNFYEHLITEHVTALGLDKVHSTDYLADICCLALNQVPPRYIRFDVDMVFYLSHTERQQMEMNVEQAVEKAVKFLEKRKLLEMIL